jgi:hypothetical protein
MMSSVTCTRRFCAIIVSRAMCLDSIMRSDDMQAIRNRVHLVYNPRRDPVNTLRDPARNRMRLCSRDRSRRT